MKLDPRLLHLARHTWPALLAAIACGLFGGLLLIAQAWLLTEVLDDVFLMGLALEDVRGLLASLLLVIILRGVLAWSGDISASRAATHIKAALRQRVLAHLFARGPLTPGPSPTGGGELPPSPFGRGVGGEGGHEGDSGNLAHTLTEGIEALDAYFSQYLPQVALALLIPLAILIVVFPLDPLSGLVLLLTGPLIPFFMALIGAQADAATKKQYQLLSRLSARFLDAIQGLTTLKLFGRSQAFAADLAHASEGYRQKTMEVLRIAFLSALTLELLATLSTALVAVQVGLRLLYNYIPFEQAFFVLLLAPEFYAPLRQLGLRFHAGMAGAAAGERVFALLEQPVDVMRDACSVTTSTHHTSRITFDHVSYTYPTGVQALHDLTCDLQPATLNILTGPSGSGKTTLVNLLLGFIHPTSGRISFQPFDCEQCSPLRASCSTFDLQPSTSNLRPAIAYVPQNPYLFQDTVATNLRLAKPFASDAELIAAAQLAHADEFIRLLPQGYDTVIGERGARLSGGQAQRLALARAFIMDAALVILDEPTAHLDSITETAILESAQRLAADRTVLLITHRSETIIADQVIRLEIESQRSMVEKLQVEKLKVAGWQVESSSNLRPFGELRASPLTFDPSVNSGQALRPATFPTFKLQPLRWLLSFLAPLVWRVSLSVLLGFATIAAGIGLMGASAYLIAAAALHPSIAALQVTIVGVRFFGLSRGVLRYLERLVAHDTTFRVLGQLRDWFYRALEPLSPLQLQDTHSGDLLGRAIGDINLLENFYVRAAAPPLVALLVTLATGLLVGTFAWPLAAILLIFLLCQGLLSPLIFHALGKAPGHQLLTARAHLNVLTVDALQGMADLLVCGAAMRWQRSVDEASQAILALQARITQLTGLQNALGIVLANLGMLAMVTLAIPLVHARQIDGVWLSVLALIALTSFEAVLPLPQAAAHIETHRQAAARLLALAVLPSTALLPPHRPALSLPSSPFTLTANKISFSYPQSPNHLVTLPPSPTLTDITFSLPPGKRLTIVGPSGAGKTTLLNILLGFLSPTSGHLSTDLQPSTFDPSINSEQTLHPLTAVVSQHTYLFSATIRENLLLARADATQAQLEDAAQAAQIHDWIASLPDGYDTWVGEHGLRISGGQRQRLAIARALLRDAPLFLLDEPTAHLDAATETDLIETLHSVLAGRSVIWVTHRLVGMEWMDEILVLDVGRIVERGTHAELLAAGGLYGQMGQRISTA